MNKFNTIIITLIILILFAVGVFIPENTVKLPAILVMTLLILINGQYLLINMEPMENEIKVSTVAHILVLNTILLGSLVVKSFPFAIDINGLVLNSLLCLLYFICSFLISMCKEFHDVSITLKKKGNVSGILNSERFILRAMFTHIIIMGLGILALVGILCI